MKQTPYNFELKEIVAQFSAAFDDITLKRFNNDRVSQGLVKVPFIYMPKKRVMQDVINKEKAYPLPVIGLIIGGVQYNTERERNKQLPFNLRQTSGGIVPIVHATPIDITINMTIVAKYQNDIDQIVQNFGTVTNPYVYLGWKIPFGAGTDQIYEINVPVIWDGSLNLDYNVSNLSETTKDFITCETSFIIQSWWFKTVDLTAANKPILYVGADFDAVNAFPLVTEENYQEFIDSSKTENISVQDESYSRPV